MTLTLTATEADDLAHTLYRNSRLRDMLLQAAQNVHMLDHPSQIIILVTRDLQS